MVNKQISRWAGWGRDEDAIRLKDRPGLLRYLRKQLGELADPAPPMPIRLVRIPPHGLTAREVQSLTDAVGSEAVDFSDTCRAVHSVGKSYRDMIAGRTGQLSHATDVVVFPSDEDQVTAILKIAARHGLAVVPFGGGTSVVGGVEPRAGPHHAVITLDLVNLNEVRIDQASHVADIGAGAFGPRIEQVLNAQGFTLGHFPQSFEFSTFGGWLATRGAGQQSSLYGKIEEMVLAVRMATPVGMVVTRRVPASAAGPSVLQLIAGSEGTLGVMTAGTARIRPLPECTRFLSYLLPDWSTALGFIRRIMQAGLHPSVVRLSDPEETRWLMKAGSGSKGLVQTIGRAAVRPLIWWRRFDPQRTSLCILSYEGSIDSIDLACEQTKRTAAACRAMGLGSSPGRSWQRDRFRLPYLRDELMARGIMVDTLETATTWGNIERLYEAVRNAILSAIQQGGTPGTVMTHLSHAYPTGASLYYTFVARQKAGDEIGQWERIKRAATGAIHKHDGTLSHHHGIGYEHLPLEAENGPAVVEALRSLKSSLDPAQVMNPEKLINR
jgi:alkyldihydroxyacetonephosphate synthase